MSGPSITDEEINAVTSVLKTPVLSIGPWVESFEQRVAAYVGTKRAAGVSNGTAGLHMCVIAAGLADGDLCITTPFSFVASSNCLLYERAVPVFVDIDPESLNIDPVRVAEAVDALVSGAASSRHLLPRSLRDEFPSKGPGRLKAILPVHAFGQPADMDPIAAAAQQNSLVIIEDACEALGATYKGRPAGTLGDTAVFAFYPNKQITTGEGGMIVTDRDDWHALYRSLRNQGRDVFDTWLDHSRLGYNYRLDELSAALGTVQMGRIDELLGNRERVAQMYNERLQTMQGVSIPVIVPSTTRMSWFLYVVRLAPEIDRLEVMGYLEEHGIPSRAYFSPIHLQPFYRKLFGYQEGDFPVTESVARTTLALPFSSVMTASQVGLVCEKLGEAVAHSGSKATSR